MFGFKVCVLNLFQNNILKKSTFNIYISGPNLPLELKGHVMVTSPTGKGVIVMGGISSGLNSKASKAMFELSESMQWTRLEQTLQIGHWAPLAIPIPDELVFEIIEAKNKRKKITI